MAQLEIPELAIAIAAENHNPTVLNADFLVYNGIVPTEWTPSEDRLSTPVLSQVSYQGQGVGIVSQPDKVIFTRTNGDIRKKDDPDVAAIAAKYVEALPHVQYKALAASVQGHVIVEAGMEEAKKQAIARYVARGPWCDYADGLDEASVTLTYKLENGTLRLTIGPALYVRAASPKDAEGLASEGEAKDNEELPVIHYSANFQDDVVGEAREERVANLVERLSRWREWLDTYVELVEQKLLIAEVGNG
jgi:hypothetical protein